MHFIISSKMSSQIYVLFMDATKILLKDKTYQKKVENCIFKLNNCILAAINKTIKTR